VGFLGKGSAGDVYRPERKRGEEDESIMHTHTHTHTHTHKHMQKGGKARNGNENIMKRVNLFKILPTCVRNYHNEIPSHY
jgi:hypothetical protein